MAKSGKIKGKDLKDSAKVLKKKVVKLRKKLDALAPPAPGSKTRQVSPLAPAGFPALPAIRGVAFAATAAGVRYPGRTDVMLVRLDPGTTVAGVFTRSATRAASVLDCQAKLARKADNGAGAAILVNSGNANAFTGANGMAAVGRISEKVAETLGLSANRVFTASTGVIGEQLPDDRITAKVAELAASLRPDAIEDAARAIMTTDTFAKGATVEVAGDGGTIRINGIAKGSGMIAPDMATMLVYIFTDAKISADRLQKLLSRQVDDTFNAITVDSDTSTSDALILAATGQSGAAEITDLRGKPARAFEAGLRTVMMDLAHQVVRDGEGATKFVEVAVTGAADVADARRVAFAIANSPLVKTAIAGEDPNWGRIVMAVGKSGAQADRDLLSIRFGDIEVARNGLVAEGYVEADGAAVMKAQNIRIGVDLGLGRGQATVWTCDLTHRYIDINADYRS